MSAHASDLRVDEDGFVCVVAPDSYSGFVDEDWELDELLAHFVRQGNQGALFIAYPGPDHADDLLVVDSTDISSEVYRKADGVVRVGPEGLWLTDYTQLTMAAQFPGTSPLADYAERLPVPEGTHLVTLTQESAEEPAFRLSWEPADPGAPSQKSSVPWFD